MDNFTLDCTPLKDVEQISAAYDVLVELRPELSISDFQSCFREMQGNGYELHGCYRDGELVAVAGIQILFSFSSKKHFWVYDLVTRASHRSLGYGSHLLKYLDEYARETGCTQVRLDSRLIRKEAHDFYEHKMGYEKYGFVFRKMMQV
jgi:GNAT superfamily N-acetyltransferase